MLKDIVGFEKYYNISDKGEVFSKRSGKYLKLSHKKNGYVYIELNVDGKVTYKRVHRLVAEAFIPNPNNKPFVNHIDGNKSNNSVDNLEWVTGSENNIHAIQNNLFDPYKQRHTYILLDLNGNETINVKGLSIFSKESGICTSSISEYLRLNSGIVKSGKYKGYKIITYK